MTNLTSNQRKGIYVLAIAILLIPLFWLSRPSSLGPDGKSGSPGGKLAQLRTYHELDESQLGNVDMLSISFRLFGMTPIANTVLWNIANDYKMKKDWTNLAATLQQLTHMMPHFETIWRFQGWNLAYNVSVEFDDYRQRYIWVIRGIEYTKEGVKMNSRSIRLPWDVAWHTTQKIGKSDEKKQFRRLYRADDDLHGSRPLEERDCWLVGKEWYGKAEAVVRGGVPLGTISEVLFYSNAPMNQINYSDNLEKDGKFDESVERAWKKAADEWQAFGNREVTTSMGVVIRLNEQEFFDRQKEKLEAQLESMQPGLRKEIYDRKYAKLTPAQKHAYEKKIEDRKAEEINLASEAEQLLNITNTEVAEAMSADKKGEGLKLAKQLDKAREQSIWTKNYREVVNFVYWRYRARFELEKDIIRSRKLLYEGTEAFRKGDLVVSKRNYDEAFALMRQMLDRPEFTGMEKEDTMGLDFKETMEMYQKILTQRNEQIPEDFILKDLWEASKD